MVLPQREATCCMSILSSLLGRNKQTPDTKPAADTKPVTGTKVPETGTERSRGMKTIYILDGSGREALVTEKSWQAAELADAVKRQWSEPDQLYATILDALAGGFRAELVDAAKRLFELEPSTVRAVCVWGIVLRKAGRLDEAAKVLGDSLAQHPKDIVILTNLAKVHAERKNLSEVEQTLWRLLEIQPNHQDSLEWLGAIARERGGAEAQLEAMKRAAALPGSWRAPLWLARDALARDELTAAQALYEQSLAAAGKPAPTDLLLQMSGDLGEAGHLLEILQSVEPLFDPTSHGLEVANNVIKANVDLGRLRAARGLLDQLEAQHRSEWTDAIDFWNSEISRAKEKAASAGAGTPTKIVNPRVAMLTGRAPLWLRSDSHFADLFPDKAKDGPVLCFLGSSVTLCAESSLTQTQLSEAAAQLSRALPLFLAEQVELGSTARTQTLMPWVMEPGGGFIVSSTSWCDADAIRQSEHTAIKTDYVVTCHLKQEQTQWVATLRLVRTQDAQCLGEISHGFGLANLGEGIRELADRVLTLHADATGAKQQPFPKSYTVPDAAVLPTYLARLERLLAIRCGAIQGASAPSSKEQRQIIDDSLLLCLDHPASVSMRVLFAQTLRAMKRVRPEVLPEFAERVQRLQKEHSLVGTAQQLIQAIVDEAFGKASKSSKASAEVQTVGTLS